MKASLYTLGCRVNQYESDAIAEKLKENGFEIVPFGEKCDVTVINTCTVTAESDRKSGQICRRAKKMMPEAAVIVTGCFAQVSPEKAKETGADAVVGNGEKEYIADIAKELSAGGGDVFLVGDIFSSPYPSLSVARPKRARTFIKIEDGCENRCAYCIIPKARGCVRSRPLPDVISEVGRISRAGCREMILTGIETASYGKDLGNTDLAELIERVSLVRGVDRITLGSLDPSVMREDFVKKLSGIKQLLPHFHLSVQSGCTGTLNRMRRKYTAEKVLENMERVRKYIPGVTFSADIIVGFPGETEEDFRESADFCMAADFLHLHIFPYSERKGTEAAEMAGKVPEEERHRRAAILSEMQKEHKEKFLLSYVKEHSSGDFPVFLLCEKCENGYAVGHTEHFVECRVPVSSDRTGDIIETVLSSTDGESVLGTEAVH